MSLTGTGWWHATFALLVYASAVRCELGPDQEELRRSVRPLPALPAAIAMELASGDGQAQRSCQEGPYLEGLREQKKGLEQERDRLR